MAKQGQARQRYLSDLTDEQWVILKPMLPPAPAPNTYQGSGVKRADGCTTGAGWPSAKQTVKHHSQASAADLISVAGHSLRLHQTPIEDRCFRGTCSTGNSSPRKGYVLETLSVPSCRSSQSSGLCPKTLLVSVRLGGGAATGALGDASPRR